MNTNTHTQIKTLTKEETEFYRRLPNMTMKEICDEYCCNGYHTFSIEEIIFDDDVEMDICLTFDRENNELLPPNNEPAPPYMYAVLYDGKNGKEWNRTAAIPFSYDNFLGKWSITTKDDNETPTDCYIVVLKADDDCENDNPSNTETQKPTEEKSKITIQTMTFGDALTALKNGKQVFRTGWNGKGMYLTLQQPDENSKMTLPYIYMRTAQGDFVPWFASQTDMLAEDWQETKACELTVKQLWNKYLEYVHEWIASNAYPTNERPLGFDEWYDKWFYNYNV